MAEENNAPDGAVNPEQQAGQRIGLQRLFLKDVSFEAPNAPEIFNERAEQPEVQMNLAHQARSLGNDLYEVVLTVTVNCKFGEQVAYHVEVQQGGVFVLQGFEQRQLHAVLGAYCPSSVFPYARQAVSDLILNGGFPALLLQPINFDQVYAEQLRQQAQAQAQEADATTPVGNA